MSELDEQIANRREKLAALEAAGVVPYPHVFPHDAAPHEIQARWEEATAEELEAEAVPLAVPGRVTAIRSHGKTVFVDVSDGRAKLQLFIRTKKIPEASATVLENLDLGDWVGASGTLMRTRMGELSLAVDELTLLAKALRPLPEKWHGLTDVEARYRQRYLDLVANPESRRVFEVRSRLVAALRRFFDERGFLEVETPMMQTIAGGAVARPFVTHHNALDLDLYLRIAPELFLKRLLVGGLPKVYEINRNFRNEGLSPRHNPEFTMLEFYWAYADYRRMMELVEEAMATLAREVLGSEEVRWRGEAVSLAPPYPRLSFVEAIVTHGGVDAGALESTEGVEAELARRGIDPPEERSYGRLLAALFEKVAEPHLAGPVFLVDHPVEVSPLAKARPDDPRFTERFELYVGAMELANGFSELNDPRAQAERFRQQLAAREAGDAEAHRYDADYVRALEHGMPPAAGCGVGIDRLAMLFTDRPTIRDVILFPLLKPEEGSGEEERSGEETASAGQRDGNEEGSGEDGSL